MDFDTFLIKLKEASLCKEEFVELTGVNIITPLLNYSKNQAA